MVTGGTTFGPPFNRQVTDHSATLFIGLVFLAQVNLTPGLGDLHLFVPSITTQMTDTLFVYLELIL